MTEQERWTIGRLLTWTTDYLKKNGAESPRLDAEVLLADARNCQRIQLYTAFDEETSEEVRTKFRDLVKRRAAGEPVAYLVGRREFYSIVFHVSPAVLIPRPETEFVVIAALDFIAQRGKSEPIQVADVGTGSGCIAISVARHAPQAQITAVDVSPAALEVAQANSLRLGTAERIRFLHSNLLDGLDESATFDLILSNPPYISRSEYNALPADVKNHEPELALVGGNDGMEVIQRLVQQTERRLRPGGAIILEISPMLAEQVQQLLSSQPALTDVKIQKDLAGLARVALARRRS